MKFTQMQTIYESSSSSSSSSSSKGSSSKGSSNNCWRIIMLCSKKIIDMNAQVCLPSLATFTSAWLAAGELGIQIWYVNEGIS